MCVLLCVLIYFHVCGLPSPSMIRTCWHGRRNDDDFKTSSTLFPGHRSSKSEVVSLRRRRNITRLLPLLLHRAVAA